MIWQFMTPALPGQQKFDNQYIRGREQIPSSPEHFVIVPAAIAAGFLFKGHRGIFQVGCLSY